MKFEAEVTLKDLGINIDIARLGKDLSISERQLIAIAKVISTNAKVLIFDEATSALTGSETKKLFNLINRLKEKNLGIIFVTHRLDEIFEICDQVTVLRDGKHIVSIDMANYSMQKLIQDMVGKNIETKNKNSEILDSDVILKIESLQIPGVIKDVSFELKRGEILGIAGLMGSGRTEILRAIFGDLEISDGKISINGVNKTELSPTLAIKSGIGLVPEDRKSEGLIVSFSLRKNISMAVLNKLKKFGFLLPRS